MKKIIGLICLLLISPLNFAALPDFEQIDESVVRIIGVNLTGIGMGTGFVINEQHIVTNHHVVKGVIKLIIADGGIDDRHSKAAIVKWSSAAKDLAILQVNLRRPALSLSRLEPNKGTLVFAVGFPAVADIIGGTLDSLAGRMNFLEPSVTRGSISRLMNTTWGNDTPLFRMLQHNAEINSGNSGGPLINPCGEVVGVNTGGAKSLVAGSQVEVAAGVFYASHISSLIEVLNAQNIPFYEVGRACTASSSSTNYLWVGIIAVILALLAVLFSLKQPRQQIIQAVETYTQRLRRTDKAKLAYQYWTLSGFTKQAQAIQLTITLAQLQQAAWNLTIGRSSKLCELVINDDSISRRHARLTYVENNFYIEDLNSSNGTRIDRVTIKPFKATLLMVGQMLTLGEVKLSLN